MTQAARFFGKRATAAGRYAVNPFTTLGFYTIYGDVSEKFRPGKDLFYAAGYLTFAYEVVSAISAGLVVPCRRPARRRLAASRGGDHLNV